MSFILDALRKSESERQQDSRPNIARIPDAVHPRKLPAWALGTMTLLGLGVLELGAAWWRSTHSSPRDATTAAATSEATLQTPSERFPQAEGTGAASQGRGAGATAALPIPPQRAAEQVVRQEGDAARTSLRSAVADSAVRETVREPQAAIRPSAAAALPALDPLLPSYAPDSGLPPLRLELHAYGDAPADRFVFINGRKYTEGDTLSDGPRLVAITTDGAVLLAAGRQMLLRQE
jgi:general secretion pathway protein B